MSDDDRDSYLYRVMRGLDDPSGLAQQVDDTVLDLGHDVRVQLTVRREGGPFVGLIESHRSPDGHGCGGSVTFDVPEAEGLSGPRWQVASWDPLTITPSILCSCGNHGFITAGRWVPA